MAMLTGRLIVNVGATLSADLLSLVDEIVGEPLKRTQDDTSVVVASGRAVGLLGLDIPNGALGKLTRIYVLGSITDEDGILKPGLTLKPRAVRTEIIKNISAGFVRVDIADNGSRGGQRGLRQQKLSCPHFVWSLQDDNARGRGCDKTGVNGQQVEKERQKVGVFGELLLLYTFITWNAWLLLSLEGN